MLRRLNVRTRLMAVIAVPLLLFLAIAIPEGLQRWERATSADRAGEVVAQTRAVSDAVRALQAERLLSAAKRAGAEEDPGLAAQRRATDRALERARGAIARLSGVDAPTRTAAAGAALALGDLEDIRAEVDATTSDEPWPDPFRGVIGDLLDLQDAAGVASAELGAGDGVSSAALVARVGEATSAQSAELAAGVVWGELRNPQRAELSALRVDEAGYAFAYLAGAPVESRAIRRTELLAPAVTAAGGLVDEAARTGSVEQLGALDDWLGVSDGRQAVLSDVELDRSADGALAASRASAASRRSASLYLLLAGSAIVLGVALALAAARSITRPLRALTDAADDLASDRLPKLVDALRNPVDEDAGSPIPAVEPIRVRSKDELGRLARSFNAVQSVAVDVASEQSQLLRKGISDLYVNLARRNQALIDRQIQLLDQLEGDEQDPAVLSHLFMLDHLATRMRRNAESLLILAGAETAPRRAKHVSLVDVVRASLSEVEEYERVELGQMAPAMLHGPAVRDVAHLVAELLENATHFSPPQTAVRVDGTRSGASYQLVITDRGVGMRADQLAELNALLEDPPVTGLALGRSLGCLVAARLAARHGITVRLRAGEQEGIAAYVVLPSHLLVEEVVVPYPPARLVEPRQAAVVAGGRPAPVPTSLSEVLPARNEFEEGLLALLEEDGLLARLETPEPVGADDLTRRVPGATTEAPSAPPAVPPVRRSPDEVRSMLSRYRSGLLAGRSDGLADEEDR